MSALPSLPDIISLTVSRTRVTRYPVVACYTVLLYEFFLVFDQEYRLIYQSKWTLAKCLYLACRFIPILLWPANMYNFMNDHSLEACKPLAIISALSYIPFLALPQCTYVFRAWSITGRKVSLLWLFLGCLVAYLAILLWSATDKLTVSDAPFSLLPKAGCFRVTYRNQNPTTRAIFAALGLDSIVGAVLIHHYLNVRRSQGRLGKLIFNQDLFYFPFILLLNTATAVILTSPSRDLDRTALIVVLVMANITACRFILQIRELSQWPTEISELEQCSHQVREDLERMQMEPSGTLDEPALIPESPAVC
ncbi:hypothetical protein CPB83DRAFT_91861 [Crepidotus variabilis]|uniref:DUF6533 domain-containing protein n=1 Tax=Crepidotus variabilis TaxID=179855 RepID=A0A9P6E521_9AGAR|nr:hypothetical protein CPB83DRAFT_91861 [Crepidotus variabilis]